jgi:hypothetical protein
MSGESVNALFGLFGANLLDTAECVCLRNDMIPLLRKARAGPPEGVCLSCLVINATFADSFLSFGSSVAGPISSFHSLQLTLVPMAPTCTWTW